MLSSSHILAFLDIGGGELMIIFLVILLLFGGQRLPELAKGLGKSMREFKKVSSGVEEEIKRAMDDTPSPSRPAPLKPVTKSLPPEAAATPPAPTVTPPDDRTA
jgi:sec-independent protein translocase protein TatA